MNAPEPRTANLADFGLPPLPADGAASKADTDSTDPNLSLAVSRRRFGIGAAATAPDGAATASKSRGRAPRGTVLRLGLSEPARVRFELLTKGKGRRVGKRCVKQTRANSRRKRCIRLTSKGAFSRSAPAGASRVPFSGRVGRKPLKPGSYVIRATPTDAAGNTGEARSTTITIVAGRN